MGCWNLIKKCNYLLVRVLLIKKLLFVTYEYIQDVDGLDILVCIPGWLHIWNGFKHQWQKVWIIWTRNHILLWNIFQQQVPKLIHNQFPPFSQILWRIKHFIIFFRERRRGRSWSGGWGRTSCKTIKFFSKYILAIILSLLQLDWNEKLCIWNIQN